jgi:RNA polymerase sigma factor (sigma-70 family)
MTDAEIIKCLRNSDYSAAIKGLYAVLDPAKQYIIANNGTAEDARDIFQDALVVLYRKAQEEGFVLSAPLKNYLMAVVKNCWLKELRRRKKLPAGEMLHDVEDSFADEEPSFQFASTAFNQLGEKCRKLLILFYFKQKTFKEIARSLDFSDERVAKNQKYRCLEKAKVNFFILSKTHAHEQ